MFNNIIKEKITKKILIFWGVSLEYCVCTWFVLSQKLGSVHDKGDVWNKDDLNVNARMRIEIDLNESEIDLINEYDCEHFLKAKLDRP